MWAQTDSIPSMSDTGWGRDTTNYDKVIPIGQYMWSIDERLGDIKPASENPDTALHNFQNWRFTDGMNGEYNHLGSAGSPRMSRIYINRKEDWEFMFQTPLDYFAKGVDKFLFTNTKSPITNIAYHRNIGNLQTGQDRVYAYFATNINKNAGLGFKLDYNYARGSYQYTQNSQFGGVVYGYYLGERYNMHAYINFNHLKRADNGGIQDDRYIETPDAYSRTFSSRDIPANLQNIYNRDDNQTYYLTHRYHLGHYRILEVPDSLKPTPPGADELYFALDDSTRQVLDKDSLQRAHVIDSLRQDWESKLVPPREFIPVASIIHTFKARNLKHQYYDQDPGNTPFFTNDYHATTHESDDAAMLGFTNTVGLSMNEGFRRWVKMGITLFATHQYRRYGLSAIDPDSAWMDNKVENDFRVGGQISKANGRLIHYNVNGDICLIGTNVGDFDIQGNADLNFRFGKKDSVRLETSAYIRNQRPTYFLRHYNNSNTRWSNDDLSRQVSAGVRASLWYQRTKTRLYFAFDNIKNYTPPACINTLKDQANLGSTIPEHYTHDVKVLQYDGNVQVLTAGINQELSWKIFHLDLEGTFQHSTQGDILPLPKFTAYANAYIVFRIAKVLRVQMGADLRYFTTYYAPDYSPSLGMYAIQDTTSSRVKIGNYPIVNAYANFHLKHCRFYIDASHVNASEGRSYLVPHLPIDPLTINIGLSWNFFN